MTDERDGLKSAPPAPAGAAPAAVRERAEPHEAQRPLPWFVVMLIGAMAMWGVFYIWDMQGGLDSRYGDHRTPAALAPPQTQAKGSAGDATPAADGAQLYAAHCVACHQASGLGLPGVFPPLAGSEWVLGSEKVLVQIPLHGVTGALQVGGVVYNGVMPAFGTLSDDEIAAVLSHVRNQWGNTAPSVSAASVRAGRQASSGRSTPWASADEIRKGAAP